MKSLLFTLLLTGLCASAAIADTQERDIQRIQVIHCVSLSETPPVVVIDNASVPNEDDPIQLDVSVEDVALDSDPDGGEEADPVDGTECKFYDSHAADATIAGFIVSHGDDDALNSIQYAARLFLGTKLFSIADMVYVTGYNENGSVYSVESWVVEDQLGDPVAYDMIFSRRAPDLQLVSLDGEDYTVPNYDHVTIVTIKKTVGNNEVFFTLFYE